MMYQHEKKYEKYHQAIDSFDYAKLPQANILSILLFRSWKLFSFPIRLGIIVLILGYTNS